MAKPDMGPNEDADAPEIELGERYRDVVTKFEGVAIIASQHLNGCRQIALDPGIDKDGNLRNQHWFDEQRLVLGESDERVATSAPAGNALRS